MRNMKQFWWGVALGWAVSMIVTGVYMDGLNSGMVPRHQRLKHRLNPSSIEVECMYRDSICDTTYVYDL